MEPHRGPRHQIAVPSVTRGIGAVALLIVGGVHLEQYRVAHFSVIPTIGPLFLVNFIAATSLGLLLLIPIRRSAHHAAIASLGVFLAIADRRAHERRGRAVARDETGKAASTPTASEV
jgi:hypothetical protein